MEGSRWWGLRTEEVTPDGKGKENSAQATCQGCSHTFFQRGEKWFIFQNILKVLFHKTSNYMMCKTTTRESTLEWTPLQNRSLLNCMRASSIPSHMQDRKSKIKFFITEKLSLASCTRRELAVLSLCWKIVSTVPSLTRSHTTEEMPSNRWV